MAFATSNVQKAYFGVLKVTRGNWSGAVGDAAGTIGVEGGQVWLALFNAEPASGATTYQPKVEWSPSTSGNVTTLTVYNQQAVSSGTFIIIHG